MRTWLARAAISALAVAGLVWFVPVTEVWRALGRVSLWHWGTALLVFSAGHAANAMKLRLLVGTSHASATRCLRAHFAGLAANLGLPGVSGGDVVRGAYLVPVAGTARVAVAAIVDRAIDGVVLAAIGAGALVAAGRPPVTVGARPAGAVALLLVLAAIGAVLAARHLGRRSGRRPAVRAALKDLRDRPRSIVVAAVLSLTVQMAFVGTHVWLASKVGAPAALAPWLVAWTGAKLSAVLPVSLGGLGVRDAALVAVLVSYGAPADAVLAVGLLWDGALIAGSVGGFLVSDLASRRTGSRRGS